MKESGYYTYTFRIRKMTWHLINQLIMFSFLAIIDTALFAACIIAPIWFIFWFGIGVSTTDLFHMISALTLSAIWFLFAWNECSKIYNNLKWVKYEK